MLYAFEQASALPLIRQDVVDVDVNEFAILNAQSSHSGLYISQTAVCSGWAFCSNDDLDQTVALMHVFSDSRYFPRGEDSVRDYARRTWENFGNALQPHNSFSTVAFGGWPRANLSMPSDQSVSDFFKNIEDRYAVVTSAAYQEKVKAMSDPNSSLAESTKNYKEMRAMIRPFIQFLDRPHMLGVEEAMGSWVSFWIGDELYKLANKSGFADIKTDLRFQNGPHDALVLRKEKHVFVGKKSHGLREKVRLGHKKASRIMPFRNQP